MHKLLLLPALLISAAASAQKPTGSAKPVNCTALQAENAALKEKIAAYEARLGIGGGSVKIINGNDKLSLRFLSCKASKSTHRAVLTFTIQNTDEPADIVIWSVVNAWGSAGNKTSIVDEQGKSFPIEKMVIGTTQVGDGWGSARVATNVPVQCFIEVSGVPLSTTNLNSALLAFGKKIPGMDEKIQFVSGFQNIPVTWIP